MRLSDFILRNTETIVAEWESFAGTLLPAAKDMTALALRDHAQQILEAVAHDLTTTQTSDEQAEKSKGRAPIVLDAPETAAQTHAVLRARSGFDIIQLVAEYRALRASVLRLWMDDAALDKTALDDIIRFNEAIDQAVAESVGHFQGQVERTRNLFLGMLGHDMRNPLYAIKMTASLLSGLNAGEQVSSAAEVLIQSGMSMQALLDDLTDFNRTRLGLGIRVEPMEVDLTVVITRELNQFRSTYPERPIEFTSSGNCHGRWDGHRIQQVLRNLVGNAVKYGMPTSPIRISLRGEDIKICIEVANRGPTLDSETLSKMFDPLRRCESSRSKPKEDGLGLGLFIVREIVRAHGGEVEARSAEGETAFTVCLPRR